MDNFFYWSGVVAWSIIALSTIITIGMVIKKRRQKTNQEEFIDEWPGQ